jgi:regulator of sigma E protease
MNILLPIVLFGILVFIHEAGHFLLAKWAGVFVERFALGFGPALLKKKWGETEYAICLFPLGGYVKMRGEEIDEKEPPPPPDPRSFACQPVGKRFAIVAMGPVANLILPVFLFSLLFLIGTPVPTSRIGSVIPGYPADQAGLRAGDEIVRIENRPVSTWNETMTALRSRAALPTVLRIRRSGEEFDRTVTPVTEREPDIYGEIRDMGKIGIDLQPYRPVLGIPNPSSPAGRAGLRSGDTVTSVNGRPIAYFWQLEESFRTERGPKVLNVERTPTGQSSPNRVTVSVNVESLEKAGLEDGELFIREVQAGSIAAERGLRPGDKLLSLNGDPLRSWYAFRKKIQENRGEAIVVAILRDRKPLTLELVPREVEHRDEITKESRKTRQLGVVSYAVPGDPDTRIERYLNPASACWHGLRETVEVSKTTVIGLGKLITGRVGLNSIGGPIAIFYLAGSSYRVGGWASYFRIMAILSITLAVLNFLPIPILDGGHLFFFLIEAIKGSPVHVKVRNVAQQVGLMIIIGLMVLTFYVDINRYLLERIRALFN